MDVALPIPDILRVVSASPYSRLPVYQGDPANLIGVLHTKDVVTAFIGQRRGSLVSLLRPLVRVPESMPANQLLAYLREQRTHQAFVAGPSGTVDGLVTLEDVVAELLGDVADEFKGVRRRRHGSEWRR